MICTQIKIPRDILESAKKQASYKCKGNYSAYIRYLIIQDCKKNPVSDV